MLFSMASGLTEESKVPLDNLLDELYEDFVNKVFSCCLQTVEKLESIISHQKNNVFMGTDVIIGDNWKNARLRYHSLSQLSIWC